MPLRQPTPAFSRDLFSSPMFRFLTPSRRPMDNMALAWNRPQEDEFALCNLGQLSVRVDQWLSAAHRNYG